MHAGHGRAGPEPALDVTGADRPVLARELRGRGRRVPPAHDGGRAAGRLCRLREFHRGCGAHAPTGRSERIRGDADHWHRHFGLCFDTRGLLQRENVAARADCGGRWLNGSDMWMLHAWVVPGDANLWGVFAALNPVLCRRNGPDISRCPGLD